MGSLTEEQKGPYVHWLESRRIDGTNQVRPRRTLVRSAIIWAHQRGKFKSDQAALDWYILQKRGTLVK